jgi:hypothetical protein
MIRAWRHSSTDRCQSGRPATVTVYCKTGSGKLREFRSRRRFGVDILELPASKRFRRVKTGRTFEGNAVLKARHYGQHAPGRFCR